MNPVLVALGLTLFAGMATGIGSVIAFTAKRTNFRFLSRHRLLRRRHALCLVR
jgi:ZIP family zinc transporter